MIVKEDMNEEYILKIARETILDSTLNEIAEKLADQFVEKYGREVMEEAFISRDELRPSIMAKLSDKIIDDYFAAKNKEKK